MRHVMMGTHTLTGEYSTKGQEGCGAHVRMQMAQHHRVRYSLLRLDVAFVQRDRLLAAIQYDAHALTAGGFAHDDASVNFHPGAAGLAQGREPYPHARLVFVVAVHEKLRATPGFGSSTRRSIVPKDRDPMVAVP
jgi:hypothetical protein